MKKKNLKISVITPSYNKADSIDRAINSVLEQSYKNWEHIIMDGGSTDGTVEILKRYNHLAWISHKDNGQADAMNKGFAKSTGDIIVYLNADDYFYPGAFSAVIEEFEKGAKFVVGNVYVKSARLKADFLNTPRFTLDGMLLHWEPNAFCTNPVGYFYRREVQQTCPFNINNYESMDLEFLLDAVEKFPFTKIDYTLGCYEDGVGTKTSITQSKLDYWKPSTFPYLQKHINRLSGIEKKEYQKKQREGYSNMQEYMNILNSEDFIFYNPKDIPLISVIVPTYNCAQYITRAIDSVLNQNLKNLEIIIVDDASTDKTHSIINRKYGRNKMVKIITHSKNQKLGASRNTGLSKAKGKYVFFLDSDDWLEPKALIHLATIAETYNTEITACGVNRVSEDGKKEIYHSHAFSSDNSLDLLNHYTEYRAGSIVWNKLYLREFIEENNLRFIVPFWHEDVNFTTRALYACKKFISISTPYHNYFNRKSSIINIQPTPLHLRSYMRLYIDMVDFIEKSKLFEATDGQDLALRLLRTHGTNEVYPKLVRYIGSFTTHQWESELLQACYDELGIKGYALGEFFISIVSQNINGTNTKQAQAEQLQRELDIIYASRGWKIMESFKKLFNRIFPKESIQRKVIRKPYKALNKIKKTSLLKNS